MTGRKQIGAKQGPVTALLVLFGLLLNVAGAAGSLDRDPRAARLGNGEIVRSASTTRIAPRSDDDGGDRDELVGFVPPAPQTVSLASTAYPAGLSDASSAAPTPLPPPAPYQARAPPAA